MGGFDPDGFPGPPPPSGRGSDIFPAGVRPARRGGRHVIPSAIAFVVSLLVIGTVLRWPARFPADHPNARSLHDRPVPRVGGIAIAGGVLAAAAFASPPPGSTSSAQTVIVAAFAALVVLSSIDDWRGLSPFLRIVVHLACAATALVALAPGASPALLVAGTITLAAAANFYNFMDGSDGMAASMAVAGFGALAAGAAIAGAHAAFPAAVVAAVLPFLAVNRPPARMFMGDAGSVPLGFLAAALGWAGALSGAWEAWFPLLAFLPFIADAGATLARRLLRGEAFWRPHRSHYYQRFATRGAGHRGTLALWVALMAGCASTAVACLAWWPGAGPAALGSWVVVHAVVFAAIDYHCRPRA